MNELEKQIQDYIDKRTREKLNERIAKAKENNMTVYIVTANWATEDDCDSFIKVFGTYEKAHDFFTSCIADEMESDWFTEHEDMIIDNPTSDFWCAYVEGDYICNHSQYEIIPMEVQ
jgi:hypothetical protein